VTPATSERLERDLTDLGGRLAWPPPPTNLAGEVLARIEAGRRPANVPRRHFGRRLALAAAAALVVVAGSLALPVTRDAVAELLEIAGIEIRFGPAPERRPVERRSVLGTAVSLSEARAAVPFDVQVPARARPTRVWLDRRVPGGAVTLVLGDDDVLLTQFQGSIDQDLIEKVLGPGTRLRPVTVGDVTGFWISGARHTVLYLTPGGEVREDRARSAGNTLVWARGGVTYRLEADISRAEAVRLARSLR
jgi:hypothetical protein